MDFRDQRPGANMSAAEAAAQYEELIPSASKAIPAAGQRALLKAMMAQQAASAVPPGQGQLSPMGTGAAASPAAQARQQAMLAAILRARALQPQQPALPPMNPQGGLPPGMLGQ